jgi:hypothetical protein
MVISKSCLFSGWGCGALIAGLLFSSIGGSYMFLTLSIASFTSFIVYAVLNKCVFKTSRIPDDINKGQPAGQNLYSKIFYFDY